MAFFIGFNASAALPLPSRESIKGTVPGERVSEILAHIEKKVSLIPKHLETPSEIENAQMTYFLEDNLKALRDNGINCKKQSAELEQAKLRNVPRGALASELKADHAVALETLIHLICR